LITPLATTCGRPRLAILPCTSLILLRQHCCRTNHQKAAAYTESATHPVLALQVTNAEYGHGLTMSAEEHYWDFAKLQGYLTDNQLAALDYVQREVLGFVKRVMRFTARYSKLRSPHPCTPSCPTRGQNLTALVGLFEPLLTKIESLCVVGDADLGAGPSSSIGQQCLARALDRFTSSRWTSSSTRRCATTSSRRTRPLQCARPTDRPRAVSTCHAPAGWRRR